MFFKAAFSYEFQVSALLQFFLIPLPFNWNFITITKWTIHSRLMCWLKWRVCGEWIELLTTRGREGAHLAVFEQNWFHFSIVRIISTAGKVLSMHNKERHKIFHKSIDMTKSKKHTHERLKKGMINSFWVSKWIIITHSMFSLEQWIENHMW